MDRREAMKKIAVGGATVVGASAVISSPAFAYALPHDITNPSFSFASTPSLNVVRYLFDSGSASCTESASGPTQTSTLSGTYNGNTPDALVRVGATGGGSPVVLNPSGSGPVVDGNTFRFEKQSAIDSSAVNYAAGDSIAYTLTTTWTCTYSNATPPTPKSDQGTTSGTISYDGTNWSLTP
jgi:hypothetical protein